MDIKMSDVFFTLFTTYISCIETSKLRLDQTKTGVKAASEPCWNLEHERLCLSLLCLQGPSTLQASSRFTTPLTWTAGMSSQRTANAAATTRRKSRSRIASQVQAGAPSGRDGVCGPDCVGHPGTEGC